MYIAVDISYVVSYIDIYQGDRVMSYVLPEEVLSPRDHVGGVIEVIHDPGEGEMSVARVLWKKEGTEKQVIAARWNGSDERPLGNPVSRGHATWFVVD